MSAEANPAALADLIRARSPEPLARWDCAVVLGSGLSGVAEDFALETEIPYEELEGFGAATVAGHGGRLRVGHVAGLRVGVFLGRRHYYETASMARAALPARVAAAMGATLLLSVSAVGAVNPAFATGSVVAVTDHLNLMGQNPLLGEIGPEGPPFLDLADLYHTPLYEGAMRRAPGLLAGQGVLAAFSGPTYETPAEIGMARAMGADLAGMSTVPEAVWARYLGLTVAALGYVTNQSAGTESLCHDDVVRRAGEGVHRVARLVRALLATAADWEEHPSH